MKNYPTPAPQQIDITAPPDKQQRQSKQQAASAVSLISCHSESFQHLNYSISGMREEKMFMPDMESNSLLRSSNEWQKIGMMDSVIGSSRLLRSRTMSSSSALLSDSEAMYIPKRTMSRPRSSMNGMKDRENLQRIPEVDPYRILGVTRNATIAEIHNAYVRLALLNHPHRAKPRVEKIDYRDIKMKEEISDWKFIVISASYETLSNRDHRTNYNFANRNSISKDWKSSQDVESVAIGSFWGQIKNEVMRGLKISESNEEQLDHDGVPCCTIQLDARMKHKHEARDESEGSRNHAFGNAGLNLLRLRPSMIRGDSDKSDSDHHGDPRVETNQLFRGPLAALYKARSHEPFTDAFVLFERESGSAIFRYDSEFKHCQVVNDDDQFNLISQNWLLSAPFSKRNTMSSKHSMTSSPGQNFNHEIPFPEQRGECNAEQCYPALPQLPTNTLKKLCEEYSPIHDSARGLKITKTRETINGESIQVNTKSRYVGDGISIVRTERISRDFQTGRLKKSIQVSRQPTSSEDDNESYFTSCMPQSFSELIGSSLDTDNFISLGFGTKVNSDPPLPLKLVTSFDSRQGEADRRE